jgi:hypothetical protein
VRGFRADVPAQADRCLGTSPPKKSFVFGGLFKHTTTADGDYRLMCYRTADKLEIDIVTESAAIQLLGVELKAAATV